MKQLLALAIVLVPSLAIASPPGETQERGISERFAIAVNEPFFWAAGFVGVSAYVGVEPHHAIRANVARYPAFGTQAVAAIAAPSGGTPGDRGGYFDIGVGWQWYPRELWNGPTLEGGLVWEQKKKKLGREDRALDEA